MYEMVKFILVGAVAVMGLFMAVCPQKAVKAEEKENEKSLASMRKKGIMLAVLAVVCGVVFAISQFMI
ncbi:hypothetical protein [Roseburia sp. 499]|uniref:hypothetical protein n=1 Tax=Roseburia sp. 499 TaxID=1261634 RepID=UPI000952E9B5|nr:hypothetical protein [Roseburia sp. 499]WVK68516.1 hypothetical protein BIV20_08935 [Roseburia sp. 499]